MRHESGQELELLAAAVHELKTPLTLIQGLSSVLESETHGALNPQQREHVHQLQQAGYRLARLIDSLRHVESLPYSYHSQPVHLLSELRTVIEELQPLTQERTVHMEVIPRAVPPVLAHAKSLYYMLQHILATIVGQAPPGAAVVLRVHRQKSMVVLNVRLQLPSGDATETVRYIQTILDARQHPGNAQPPSGSVSLFIIRSIVEFYGGSITLGSQASDSILTVRMPMSNQLHLFG